MRRLLAIPLLLIVLTACVKPPVTEDVTVEIESDGRALITAVTNFETVARTAAIRRRIDDARTAALAGTDVWSARFARLNPELERVTFDRRRGTLERVTRVGRVPQSELQPFFSDASLTVSLLDGDGWRELAIYPGTSSRATREQRERFGRRMTAWSSEVARYFTAVHHLYSYLDAHPQRARFVFEALFDDPGAGFTEDEEPLVNAVLDAMETLSKRLEIEEGDAYAFAEEADLVLNPFPARLTIRVPSDITDAKGFEVKGHDAVAEPIDIVAAIASLEGQWISPDPLALLLRDDKDVTAEKIAAMPRRSTSVVTPSAIESALRERMQRATAYSVRWRD
jgi:hypothetical protein